MSELASNTGESGQERERIKMRSTTGRGAARASRSLRRPRPGCARRLVAATLLAAAAFGAPRVAVAGRAWIEDPTGRTVLQVAFREPPTYEDLAQTQAALTRMATIVCDATEGQIRIAQIRLVSAPASEDLAALWLHDDNAASGGPYDQSGAGGRRA